MDITLADLNPPETVIAVRYYVSNVNGFTTTRVTVDVEDLVPAPEPVTVSHVEQNALRMSATLGMQRVPQCPIKIYTLKWMGHALEAHLEACSLTQYRILEELVEVVVVRTTGTMPVLQCRAKQVIKLGSLRLYPHAAELVHENDSGLRKPIEARVAKVPDCYIRCVRATSHVYRSAAPRATNNRRDENFLFFSPLGLRGLVTHDVTTGTSDVGYIAPFWAVMMTDRDNQDLVNMQPFQDQFQMMAPVVKMYEMPFNTGMKIDLTFLTNSRDIAVGELLVLPFDGGSRDVFSRPPPHLVGSSGYEPTE